MIDKVVKLLLRLPRKLHERLVKDGEKENRSLNSTIITACERYLNDPKTSN
jgi:predicted HicB family RNase H-like nuclease